MTSEIDPIVESVWQKMYERSQAGIQKYGCTMMRDDLTKLQWLRHAQEEAMDFCIYLERLIYDEESK